MNRISIDVYVLYIQKPLEWSELYVNSIPVPDGIDSRHIRPCFLSEGSSATSTCNVISRSPLDFEINRSVTAKTSRFKSSQSLEAMNVGGGYSFSTHWQAEKKTSADSAMDISVASAILSGEIITNRW